jgi:hypothetical protein
LRVEHAQMKGNWSGRIFAPDDTSFDLPVGWTEKGLHLAANHVRPIHDTDFPKA